MSWSVHFLGKPEAIKRALSNYGSSLTDADDHTSFRRAQFVLEQLLDLNRMDNGTLSLQANDMNGVTVVLQHSNAISVQ